MTVSKVRRFFGKGARVDADPVVGTDPAAATQPPRRRSTSREAAPNPGAGSRQVTDASLAAVAATLRSEGLYHAADMVDRRRREVASGAVDAPPAATALPCEGSPRAPAQDRRTSPRPWERAPPSRFEPQLSAATHAAIAAAERGEVYDNDAANHASRPPAGGKQGGGKGAA